MSATLFRTLLAAYRCLLRAYPRPMQVEFGAEMEGVFRQTLAAAKRQGAPALIGICLRELRDWPAAVVGAHLASWPSAQEMTPMLTTTEAAQPEDRTRESWAGTLVGALPFLLFGLASALRQFPGGYDRYVYPASYVLMLVGVAVGGVRGFPRWSLIYLGWGLVGTGWWVSMGMDAVSQRLGFNLGTDQRGWAAWAPLALAVATSLLLSRSLQPLRALAARRWHNWTWTSLVAYIILSGVVLVFDENHHPDLLALIGAATLAAAAGAMLCLRGASVAQRSLGLLAGLAMMALIAAYADSTWDWRAYYGRPGTSPAPWQTFLQTVLAFSVWILVALAPALWQWLRQRRRWDMAHPPAAPQ